MSKSLQTIIESLDSSILIRENEFFVKWHICGNGATRVTPTSLFGSNLNGELIAEFASNQPTIGVSSANVNDTAAGSGCRNISISGWDSSGNEVSASGAMNGRNKISLAVSGSGLYRVKEMRTTAAGSTNANEGSIYVYDNAIVPVLGKPSSFVGVMVPSDNWTMFGQGHIPAKSGRLCYFNAVDLGGDGSASLPRIKLQYKDSNSSIWYTFLSHEASTYHVHFPLALSSVPCDNGLDIRIISTQAGGQMAVALDGFYTT